MNESLALLGVFLLGVLSGLPIYIRKYRKMERRYKAEMDQIKASHRIDWDGLMYKLNHTGLIPLAATATGLIGLILSAVSRCITSLEGLLVLKDWDTQKVITELRGIAMVELSLLHQKLGEFLKAQRNGLKEYDHKQNGSETVDQNT